MPCLAVWEVWIKLTSNSNLKKCSNLLVLTLQLWIQIVESNRCLFPIGFHLHLVPSPWEGGCICHSDNSQIYQRKYRPAARWTSPQIFPLGALYVLMCHCWSARQPFLFSLSLMPECHYSCSKLLQQHHCCSGQFTQCAQLLQYMKKALSIYGCSNACWLLNFVFSVCLPFPLLWKLVGSLFQSSTWPNSKQPKDTSRVFCKKKQYMQEEEHYHRKRKILQNWKENGRWNISISNIIWLFKSSDTNVHNFVKYWVWRPISPHTTIIPTHFIVSSGGMLQ